MLGSRRQHDGREACCKSREGQCLWLVSSVAFASSSSTACLPTSVSSHLIDVTGSQEVSISRLEKHRERGMWPAAFDQSGSQSKMNQPNRGGMVSAEGDKESGLFGVMGTQCFLVELWRLHWVALFLMPDA